MKLDSEQLSAASGLSSSMFRDLHASTRSKRSAAIKRRGDVSPARGCSQSSRLMPTTRRFSLWRQTMSEICSRATCTCVEMTARSSESRAINLSWDATGRTSSISVRDTLIESAACRQFFLKPLEAAVEMIDAIDHGFAFRGEPGNDQGHRGAQIGRHHRRAAQLGNALDGGGFAIQMDAGPEPRQLLHMHEAVFEYRLRDVRGALGARHQCHQLGLKICRETGKRRG